MNPTTITPHSYLSRIHSQTCTTCGTTETWTETFLVTLITTLVSTTPRRALHPAPDLSLHIPHGTARLPPRTTLICHNCAPSASPALDTETAANSATGPAFGRNGAAVILQPRIPPSVTGCSDREFTAPGRRAPAPKPSRPKKAPLPTNFSDLPSFN